VGRRNFIFKYTGCGAIWVENHWFRRELKNDTERFTDLAIGQAKFAYGGLSLGSNQFRQLSQVPLKSTLNLKVVKIDSKIIISLH